MKTAMNEHIEQLKAMKVILSKQYEGNELLEVVTGTIDGCIFNSEHFIETEKQQIIEAITYGNRMEFYDATETAGEQCY